MTVIVLPPGDVFCQTTSGPISGSLDGQTWTCPWCPEHETYVRLGPGDFGYVAVYGPLAACRAEFEIVDDGVLTSIWLGNGPQTIFQTPLHGYHVYLARGANNLQNLYSGAHEAFHRACTPGGVIHWVDEMLAILFSLRYLDRIGHQAHAMANRIELTQEAVNCSFEQMVSTRSVPYPAGLYGRAFIVGTGLMAVVGWDHLKRLANGRGIDGTSDVERWLTNLPDEVREGALGVLND